MKINGLNDDFIAVNGKDVLIYSRENNKSKTRVDYILSNSKKCISFEYEDLRMGFDHKMAVAKYNIEINTQKEWVPREKFWRNWVISKELEQDQRYIDKVKVLCDMTREEIDDDEILEEDKDISAYWKMLKEEIIKGAKRREREIKQEENGRLKYLNIIYAEAIEKKDLEGIKEIKDSLDEIYKNRARKQIDRIRNIEIKDHVYDIHKLQNQRKFENQKKLTEIRIKGNLYEGTQNIVEGIQKEMEVELRETISRNEILTEEEKCFLDKLEKIELSDSEVHELIKPTEEIEILNILKFEVDLDSSPGEDGITSRLLLRFMKIDAFKDIYIKYLNYTRRIGSMGQIGNLGIMVVKNKSTQSNEYEKKRKLTKINKDSNVGNGKVWTNRMKRILLTKILPKT